MRETMGHAERFQDLVVWQHSRRLARKVFEVTSRFPKEERFALVDQIRRSSRAVGAQIAEAWAKRRYAKHFISKLTDADGEQRETQHWIIIAHDCRYVEASEARELGKQCQEIGSMLGAMMNRAAEFCGDPSFTTREDPATDFLG